MSSSLDLGTLAVESFDTSASGDATVQGGTFIECPCTGCVSGCGITGEPIVVGVDG